MISKSKDDRIIDTVLYIILSFVLFIVLYPLYFVVIASFSDPLSVIAGNVWFWPVKFTLEPYRMVFRDPDILTGYKNTLLYTFFGTILNVTLTVTAAYPLSKSRLKGSNFVMKMLVFTMYFGGGLIPTYLLISKLKLLNTFWVMIISNAVSVSNIIITRTYFRTGIPVEIEESAYVDGSSHINTLVRIVLPLSKPIIAVMILFYGVRHWNSYFDGLIYLSDKSRFPLQLILRGILIQNQVSQEIMAGVDDTFRRKLLGETLKYALIIVSSVPVLCLYPFLQKYFVKGIMIGSIKG